MGNTQADPTRFVLDRCRELGFALAGVCEARPIDRPEAYRAWLDAGKHGEMAYLARNTAVRIDPRLLLPGARSIVCVADRYATASRDSKEPSLPSALPRGEGRRGRIAKYAQGDDYHVVMKDRLHVLCDELRTMFSGHEFRACVDTAPIMEREHAQRAGLGSIGKHTLLIERGVGSYLLLGEVLTTLELAPSRPGDPDPCGSCTRCIDACPTGAISPWSVDAARCISYLTIEHRSEIDPKFHGAMEDWIFGCDICQDVCPHSQPKARSAGAATNPAYSPRHEGLDLLELLEWTEEDRRRMFQSSAMKRANLDMMKRNASIALRNRIEAR